MTSVPTRRSRSGRARIAPLDVNRAIARARAVITAEARAVNALVERLDAGFVQCLQLLRDCRGRVVVTGMGKSGLVGQKISATLASTGTPSLFLHAAEALHGDLGRIVADDVVVALSNSGESEEILRLVAPIRALGAPLVTIVGAADSALARTADAAIVLGDVAEACPMGLVPTASTTAMMVVGDALSMCLFDARGLDHTAYARLHPGGLLGRKLMQVGDVMRAGPANPVTTVQATLGQVIALMSETPGRPGAASVVDTAGRLVGFFTDGDLRRLLTRPDFRVDVPMGSVMHVNPKHVVPGDLVANAVQMLRAHQIDQLPVVDDAHRPIGLLDVQDILRARAL